MAARICQIFDLDPLTAIASGALLLTTPPSDAPPIRGALTAAGIACADIGEVAEGPAAVLCTTASEHEPMPRPTRDAIAQVFEMSSSP